MKIEEFLTPAQEEAIADAITAAENNTSGEIRVHIENKCKGDPLDRAKEIFSRLGMHETRFRNGVIIFISIDDHKLAIYGDEGINSVVDSTFWNDDIEILIDYFKEDLYLEGLLKVIEKIGDKLKEFFPADVNDDPNELDNTVSYGRHDD